MGHKGVLSSKFNMSMGFIPVIISILLCEFITQDISIYIGVGVGVLYSLFSIRSKGTHIPHFILYYTTGMLLLLSITTFITGSYCPSYMSPLTLEISAMIPVWVIYLNRKRFLNYNVSQSQQCCKQLLAQGAESAIVSTKVVIIISSLHFFIILLAVIIDHPLGTTTRLILFRILPPAVFLLSILFNQFGIHYFNQIMKHTAFVPIVNKKGDVIGRSLAVDAINHKHESINPVIRIAVSSHGMLFLRPRPSNCILDKGKTDLFLECYLLFGETLQQGINRLLQQTLPKVPIQNVRFNVMYHFENEVTNRLIYLFTLELEDDSILCAKRLKNGKLWTFQQIEHNLDKNFFGSCFENEYEHLKAIIGTREKYREF